MIGVVFLGVGGVTCFLASYTVQQQHNAAWMQNVFQTALYVYIYIVTKHSFCIVSQALAMLNHCNCSVSSDITPSLAECTRLSTSSHTPHPTTAATTYFNI